MWRDPLNSVAIIAGVIGVDPSTVLTAAKAM